LRAASCAHCGSICDLNNIPEHRLRVLFVTSDDFSMPSEMQVLGFAEELVRRNHRVLISLGGDPASADREGLILVPGLEVQEHWFEGRRVAGAALEGARRFEPDIIHSWNPRVPALTAARAFTSATGAPHVVHFEDDEWRPWPLEPLTLRGRAGLLFRRSTWLLHPPRWLRSTRLTLHWVRRGAAGVDALTPALAREVEARLKRECAVILPVMPARHSAGGRSVLERRPGERIVLLTGRVMASSLPDFICAVRAVASVRRRGLDARLVQTGAVDPAFDLLGYARKYDLDESGLSLLGHIRFVDVAPTLAEADVLIQPGPPSRFNQLRLPSKLQSYLESGSPTITFSAGVGELLHDGEEVLMTHTDDPEELAARLCDVLTDRELQVRLAVGGRAAAKRLFDVTRNTDALLAYYERSLATARV
jgi:glycosyltransferase involved in cell wall biosynthesis